VDKEKIRRFHRFSQMTISEFEEEFLACVVDPASRQRVAELLRHNQVPAAASSAGSSNADKDHAPKPWRCVSSSRCHGPAGLDLERISEMAT
jgi:hypothetical protein